MVMKRDKETGETFEEPTSKVRAGEHKPSADSPGASPTGPVGQSPSGDDAAPTVPIGRARESSPPAGADETTVDAPIRRVARAQPREPGDSKTRLVVPAGRAAEARQKRPPSGAAMADPVAGWLVVIAGPGKGLACQLGYGTNTLGRGEDSRIRLDFGDDQISRDAHATVTYDPRSRKFFLLHGGGKNLTYLGDEPVLAPTVLAAMQDFSVGETTLRFVPFCGPEFDWQDTDAE